MTAPKNPAPAPTVSDVLRALRAYRAAVRETVHAEGASTSHGPRVQTAVTAEHAAERALLAIIQPKRTETPA